MDFDTHKISTEHGYSMEELGYELEHTDNKEELTGTGTSKQPQVFHSLTEEG